MGKKGYSNFVKLNKTGNNGEKLFFEWMKKHGFTNIEHIENVIKKEDGLKLDHWDLRGNDRNNRTLTFEVKTQPTCNEWDTINIEQIQYKKDGGIRKTTSDYMVYVNPVLGFGFIETSDLQRIDRIITKKVDGLSPYKKGLIIHERKLWMKDNQINYSCGWRENNSSMVWIK